MRAPGKVLVMASAIAEALDALHRNTYSSSVQGTCSRQSGPRDASDPRFVAHAFVDGLPAAPSAPPRSRTNHAAPAQTSKGSGRHAGIQAGGQAGRQAVAMQTRGAAAAAL